MYKESEINLLLLHLVMGHRRVNQINLSTMRADPNGTKLSRFSSIFSAKIEEKDCTRADFMEAFEYENITTFPTRF